MATLTPLDQYKAMLGKSSQHENYYANPFFTFVPSAIQPFGEYDGPPVGTFKPRTAAPGTTFASFMKELNGKLSPEAQLGLVENLYSQGYFKQFGDYGKKQSDAIGRYIASGQAARDDEIFGGLDATDLGMASILAAPVAAWAMGAGAPAGAAAADTAAAATSGELISGGSDIASLIGSGGSDALAGGGFTGGFTGTAGGAPGLAGGAATAPLGGAFAAESMYPVIGGQTAAATSGGAAALGGSLGAKALGALGGAALGMFGGGSSPAGSTTTNTTSSTVIPEWQRKLIQPALKQGQNLMKAQSGYSFPLLAPAQQSMLGTIQGSFLSPDSNPFLRQYGNALAQDIAAPVTSLFSGAGRYGSGAHQGTVAREVGTQLSKLYGGAYESERGRMADAAALAPAFEASTLSAPWAPLNNFMNLAGKPFGQSSTGTQTQPYFQNKTGNLLGGALIGSQIFSNLFA